MILLSLLFYLFIIISLLNIIHFALFLVGADLYDIRSSNRLRKHNKNEPDQYKPLVTVLVPAYNEEKVVERCLQSIWNNTYDKIEIIVISDGSTDGTETAVQRFIDSRTRTYRQTEAKVVRTKDGLRRVWQRGYVPISRRVRIIRQINGGKASALNNGLRYHTKGELVMMLDADSLIHNKAIANAVRYFNNPNVVGVAANVRIIEEFTVLGLLQRFEHMIAYRSKKFFTLTNCELIVGGVASTYRKSVLDWVGHYSTDTVTEDIGLSIKIAARGNKKYGLIYAADVAAMTEGVQDFSALLRQRYRWKLGNLQNLIKYRRLLFNNNKKYSRSLTWYRVPMAYIGELMLLMEPLAVAYILYLSIHFLTPALIISAYLTITIYVLWAIWPDEHLSFSGKVKASLFTPTLYFIFYLMNFVQLVSIIRCLINHKQVTNLSKKKNAWSSPQRVGGAVSFS